MDKVCNVLSILDRSTSTEPSSSSLFQGSLMLPDSDLCWDKSALLMAFSSTSPCRMWTDRSNTTNFRFLHHNQDSSFCQDSASYLKKKKKSLNSAKTEKLQKLILLQSKVRIKRKSSKLIFFLKSWIFSWLIFRISNILLAFFGSINLKLNFLLAILVYFLIVYFHCELTFINIARLWVWQ